jgi:hypothetical protein
MDAPVIGYQGQQPQRPALLTLEQGPGVVTVTFPGQRQRAVMMNLYSMIALGTLGIVSPAIVLLLFWLGLRRIGLPLPNAQAVWPYSAPAIWEYFLPLLFFWMIVIALWRRYRKWGQVPRTLCAAKTGITLTYLGWFGMRRKFWPSSQITGIEILPLKWDLDPRKISRELIIFLSTGKSVSFRLPTRDLHLAKNIETQIRKMVFANE